MVRRARSQKGVIFDEIGRPGGCFLIGTRYNHPERAGAAGGARRRLPGARALLSALITRQANFVRCFAFILDLSPA